MTVGAVDPASEFTALLLVRDLMTPKPIAVSPDTRLVDALEIMDTRRFRHLPVVDADHRVLGVVTLRDLLRIAWQSAADGDKNAWREYTVAAELRPDPDTVEPHATAASAARRILRTKRSCLPVVDGDGKLVGILTEADFLRLVVREAPPETWEAE
jgi:CBS domain-containing protein